MSNSPMVVYTKISPNSSARTAPIQKITIHHMAGTGSVEACGAIFANSSRGASSNYGVDSNGRVGLYVDESRRAWTSSNRENDNVAVTIEVANDEVGGNWHVSDKALAALIDLCEDICRRNEIPRLNFTGDKSGNLTMHKWFAPTACPGPYLESKFPYVAEEVNRRLAAAKPTEPQQPDHATPEEPDQTQDSTIRYCVRVGTFSDRENAKRLLEKLSAAGFAGFIDTLNAAEPTKPQPEQPAKKSAEEVAQEVVWGLWGVGADRRQRLTEAGYDYLAVQCIVDKIMGR